MLSQEELDKLLEQGSDEAEETAGQQREASADGKGARESTSDPAGPPDGGASDADWSDAFAEAAAGGDSAAAKAMEGCVNETVSSRATSAPSAPSPSAPTFDEFAKIADGHHAGGDKPDLDFILDLPLEISVELGRSKLQIRDLLQLGQGSVIQLAKMAGEPAEIFVNQKLMAKGEVVVVNEKFGIRLTEIISPADRVKNLA